MQVLRRHSPPLTVLNVQVGQICSFFKALAVDGVVAGFEADLEGLPMIVRGARTESTASEWE